MSLAIHFTTSMFDVTQEKENPINPVYGISLLLWLKDQLNEKFAITEPGAEDWGWYSEISFQRNSYLIGAAAYFEEGDDPTADLDWVFQVDKHRSLKEKLWGKNKMSDSDSCFIFFRELFKNHPRISRVEVD